ncbi:MAG TPA: 3-hydroxyacyl-ACP dehydratase [Puia sp.]|jgi:predicted hotdog family 3-hydroxylacyl-ACP dehydratase
MIDRLVYSDASITKTVFRVTADNIFVANGRFREPGLLENIAQTAAAGAGALALQEGRSVAIGYIAAVKDLEIGDLPAVNDELITEIKMEDPILDVTVVSGKLWCNGKMTAQCEMKIFVQNT